MPFCTILVSSSWATKCIDSISFCLTPTGCRDKSRLCLLEHLLWQPMPPKLRALKSRDVLGWILAMWIWVAKLPNSHLNFAMDFGVDFFLLFFPRTKARTNPPKNPPQNSQDFFFRKNYPWISAEAFSWEMSAIWKCHCHLRPRDHAILETSQWGRIAISGCNEKPLSAISSCNLRHKNFPQEFAAKKKACTALLQWGTFLCRKK